jgi:hypothetical protein
VLDGEVMVVFGGRGDRDISFNETYLLNTQRLTWSRKLTMNTPPATHFHSAVLTTCQKESVRMSSSGVTTYMMVYGGGVRDPEGPTKSRAGSVLDAKRGQPRFRSNTAFLGAGKSAAPVQKSPLQSRHSPSFLQLSAEITVSSQAFLLDLGTEAAFLLVICVTHGGRLSETWKWSSAMDVVGSDDPPPRIQHCAVGTSPHRSHACAVALLVLPLPCTNRCRALTPRTAYQDQVLFFGGEGSQQNAQCLSVFSFQGGA